MQKFDSTTRAETYKKIGAFESWLEDGSLRIYSHPFGQSTGFSMKMTPEETNRLLEWLGQHYEEISISARKH